MVECLGLEVEQRLGDAGHGVVHAVEAHALPEAHLVLELSHHLRIRIVARDDVQQLLDGIVDVVEGGRHSIVIQHGQRCKVVLGVEDAVERQVVGGDGDGAACLVMFEANRLPLPFGLVVVGGTHLLLTLRRHGNDDVGCSAQLVLAVRQAEVYGKAARNALHDLRREHGVAHAQLHVAVDTGGIELHRALLGFDGERRVVQVEHLGIVEDEAGPPRDAVNGSQRHGEVGVAVALDDYVLAVVGYLHIADLADGDVHALLVFVGSVDHHVVLAVLRWSGFVIVNLPWPPKTLPYRCI